MTIEDERLMGHLLGVAGDLIDEANAWDQVPIEWRKSAELWRRIYREHALERSE